MPTSKKITDFVINKVPTKAIFNKMKEQGLINNDEIYLVEEDDLGYTDIVPINHGGTGASTAANARANIGIQYGTS